MKISQITNIITNFITEANSESKIKIDIHEDMLILGDKAGIDSMKLIELCLLLEEKAEEYGFNFDWTSEKAMSKTNSIFKSPKSLSKEFELQYLQQKK